MDNKKINTFVGYLQVVLQAIISLAYIPILISGIGEQQYGLYQIICSIAAYVGIIENSFSAAITKFYVKYKTFNDKKNMENVLYYGRSIFLIITLIILIGIIPLFAIMNELFKNSFSQSELVDARFLLIIMIINLLVSMSAYIHVSAITANEKFLMLKLSNLLTTILQPLFVIIMIKKYPLAITVGIIFLIINIIRVIFVRFYSIKKIGTIAHYHNFNRKLFFDICSLSLSVLFVVIADQIFFKTDEIIIGSLYGTKSVSVYSIGSQFNLAMISMGSVIVGMLMPTLTRIINKKDNNALNDYFVRISRFQTYLIMFVLTGFILFGRDLILIMIGEDYSLSYYVALLLMIPYSMELMQSSILTIMQIKDKYYYRSIGMCIFSLINIFFTIYLSQKIGIIGAAMSTTIVLVLGNIIFNIIYQKILKIDIIRLLKDLFPIVFTAFLCLLYKIFVPLISLNSSIINLIINICIYSFVYLITMYKLCMNDTEKKFVKRFVKFDFHKSSGI